MIPQAPYLKVKKRLPLKQSDDLVKKIYDVIDKGYSHISATNFLFYSNVPLAPALPPLVRGRMRFTCITGNPNPWLYNIIATGAP